MALNRSLGFAQGLGVQDKGGTVLPLGEEEAVLKKHGGKGVDRRV
jgi:hypothetical protein